LRLNGRDGQDTAKVDDNSWKVIEKDLHSLARRFNDVRPGEKMEAGLRNGCVGTPCCRARVLRTLNGRFVPKSKEEAVVLVPYMGIGSFEL
jgi:hypothetical protein